MSQRGIDFVDAWIRENINAQPYLDEEGHDERPREFAKECLAAARAEGISKKEIEEDVGDLEDRMAEAIDAAADAEVARLAAKDD